MTGNLTTNPSLWTHLSVSEQRTHLAGWVAILEKADVLDHRTRLIPMTACSIIVAEIDRRQVRLSSMNEALDEAESLMGMYPSRLLHNSDVFARALRALFEAYEIEFVRRVVDPIHGIPGRSKFAPTIAEVKESLDGEKAKRFNIRATAQWMIQEHERRRLEAAEAKRWEEVSPEQLESRRKRVDALLKPWKDE